MPEQTRNDDGSENMITPALAALATSLEGRQSTSPSNDPQCVDAIIGGHSVAARHGGILPRVLTDEDR